MTAATGRLAPLLWAIVAAPLGAVGILIADRTDPVVPLGLLAGVGALALAYSRPLLSVLLAIALVPLEVVSIPLGALALSPTELVFVLTGFVWAARQLVEGRSPWPTTPLSRPLLLLWLAGIPGILVAVEPAAVIRFLVIWGAFLFVFAAIAQEADGRWVRNLLLTLALAGAAVGVIAAATSTGQELSATGDVAEGRAVGAFGSPNILATFLAMTLPAALFVSLDVQRGRRPVAVLGVGLILAGLALSLSRGGLLAAGGAVLLMLNWAPLRRTAALAALALAGVTLFAANPLGDVQQVRNVVDRVESVRFQAGSRADQRGRIYSETPKLIADYWLTGVGASNYPNVARRYGIIEPISNETFAHAHNLVLTVGADFGMLGLVALAWLLVALARTAPVVLRRGRADRGAGFAVVGALVALGLQGLVDFTLYSNVIAALLFVFLGLLAALSRQSAADAGLQTRVA